ncbi:hypothetical protein I317_07503 [Kwoniella heveanensis CBS 569]|nr:hypothetical protein I317_07503 [Kwoniella heveanensis CBS 569]
MISRKYQSFILPVLAICHIATHVRITKAIPAHPHLRSGDDANIHKASMVEYRSVSISTSAPILDGRCICAYDPDTAMDCFVDCANDQITYLSEEDLSHLEKGVCHCPLNVPDCACTSPLLDVIHRRDAASVSVLHARSCPPDGKEVCYRIRGEIRCIPCIEERVMCPLEEREIYCLDSADEASRIICRTQYCKSDVEGNIICPSCPTPRPRPPICPLCVASDDGTFHCPPCPLTTIKPTYTYPPTPTVSPSPSHTLGPTGPIFCPLDMDVGPGTGDGDGNGSGSGSGSDGRGVDPELKKRYCIERPDGSFWCPPCPPWPLRPTLTTIKPTYTMSLPTTLTYTPTPKPTGPIMCPLYENTDDEAEAEADLAIKKRYCIAKPDGSYVCRELS